MTHSSGESLTYESRTSEGASRVIIALWFSLSKCYAEMKRAGRWIVGRISQANSVLSEFPPMQCEAAVAARINSPALVRQAHGCLTAWGH